MKNLILAVFAVLGFLALTSNHGNAKPGMDSATMQEIYTSKEMTPVYHTVKRGDRLWDYVRQYNLGHPKEIVEFNKGKVGEKCIKNENLILRKCKIAIPVYTLVQVQAQQILNEKVLEKATDVARAEGEKKNIATVELLFFALLAVCVLFVVSVVAHGSMKKRALKAEKENTDLKKRAWEASDKKDCSDELRKEADTLGREKANLILELLNARAELTAAKTLLVIAKSAVRFKAQNGQIIEFDIAKVLCKFPSCNTEVSPQNALSHYFKHEQTGEPENLKEIVDHA